MADGTFGSTEQLMETHVKIGKLLSSGAFAIAAAVACVAAVAADVNVRLMHVDQNPEIRAFYDDLARHFESTHAGVKVEILYLENEAYKKKLTTLLQSTDRPNILYSWGGGVMREQVKAGVLEDISAPMNAGNWKDRFLPAGVQAYTLDNKIYGVPF